MAKFKPGMAVYLRDGCRLPGIDLGRGKKEGVVLRIATDREGEIVRESAQCECYLVAVSLAKFTGNLLVAEILLEPRHVYYDGDRRGSFDGLPFRPKRRA